MIFTVPTVLVHLNNLEIPLDVTPFLPWQDEMASTKSTQTALNDKEQSKAADIASSLGDQ